ncbi:DMT family transporter [Neptuniibacter caesariensis]|uniref:Possible transmembrane protein n=1 Tax=Neptuniibacter caesariensis TaxID=207954 RepID=A0A7U8C8Q5_NEPCE|nr:EamA family transporter [Neptuniibacter caesariensis]EAR62150.1 possible transmembrane protein [Oceanospirillum sp. MED92] [Neptuniibacter caesariensis]
MQNYSTTAATAIGFISIVLWGTLALLTKLTDGAIPPLQLMAMTFFLAYLGMQIRWLYRGESGFRYLKQPKKVWLVGIGGYLSYHFCYFAAMARAPAVDVSLIAYLWPLFIVLFSALLPGENLKVKHTLGAVLALTGCALIITQGGNGLSSEYAAGYLFAAACALIWSSYSVLTRLISQVSTGIVGWYCLFTAVLAAIAHFIFEQTVLPETSIQWIGIVGLALGPMGLAFFTWDYGMKRGNIQLLGVLSYSAPLISTLLLVLFTDELLTKTLLVACLLIVIGSVIAGVKFEKKAHIKT